MRRKIKINFNRSIFYSWLILVPVVAYLVTTPFDNLILVEGGTLNRYFAFLAILCSFIYIAIKGKVLLNNVYLSGAVYLLVVYIVLHSVVIGGGDPTFLVANIFLFLLLAHLFSVKAHVAYFYIIGCLYILYVIVSLWSDSSVLIRRLSVDGFNQNWLSYSLMVSGYAIAIRLYHAGRFESLVLTCIYLSFGFCIFLLGSRGGLLAYLVLLLFILLQSFRLGLTKKYDVLFLILAFSGFFITVLSQLERLIERFSEGFSYDGLMDASGRTNIWREAWNSDFNPIFGEGVGAFSEQIGTASHNGFLSMLFEFGVFGLLLYCFIFLLAFLSVFNKFNNKAMSILYISPLLIMLMASNMHFHKALFFGLACVFATQFQNRIKS